MSSPPSRFPRTPHLAGRGAAAATSDDVVLSSRESDLLLKGEPGDSIVVEEKVDGANVGLSLTAAGQVSVTNRSHAADLSPGSQFSKMPGWLAQRQGELASLLGCGVVLYGEWLQLKHTVPYGGLPDWFLAFDLFDVGRQAFLSTTERDALLRKHAPSLHVVARVDLKGASLSREGLLALLRATGSAYRTDGGTPEGLVVRVERGGALRSRAKLVDPSFRQSIDATGHWMHQQRALNAVRPDLWEAAAAGGGRGGGLEGLLEEARALGRARDYEGALRAAEEACALGRDCAEAQSLRGQGLFGLGRWLEARGAFEECEGMGVCAELRAKCERLRRECERRQATLSAGESPHARGGAAQGGCDWLPDVVLSNPRERRVVASSLGDVTLMRNTSWLVPNWLLGGSTPKSQEQVVALREALGITLIVTLTEEEPLEPEWFRAREGAAPPPRNLFAPVPNTRAPVSLEQAHGILAEMEAEAARGGRVLVHCGGGKGRAGTVLACWMVKHGLAGGAGFGGSPAMGADEAVKTLRGMRPGSIETEVQRLFVSQFCSDLWRTCGQGAAAPAGGAAADGGVERGGQHGGGVGEDKGKGEQEREDAEEEVAAREDAAPPQYPRTPHVHFSPGATPDDVALPAPGQAPAARSGLAALLREQVVITEKLDGGNCCITATGKVFARTHSKEATRPWFSAAKAAAGRVASSGAVPAGVCVFCENMEAVHSIDYGRLASPLYVIAALDGPSRAFLSWADTERVAAAAGLSTAPVLWRGVAPPSGGLEEWSRSAMLQPSCVGAAGSPREGWVVRRAGGFHLRDFKEACAKYVRVGHVQTGADFGRAWRRAEWSDEVPDVAAAGGGTEQQAAHAGTAPALAAPEPDAKASGAAAKKGGGRKEAKEAAKAPKPRDLPRLVVLVGLPGSGKSTFCGLLSQAAASAGPLCDVSAVAAHNSAAAASSNPPSRGGARLVRVSQDELGGRRSCEEAIGRELLGRGGGAGTCVVLDRCNCAAKDREEWLGLAMQAPKHCVCVYFDVGEDVCRGRVAAREGHPTIPKGGGRKAVQSHARLLEPPTAREGFSRVYTVRSEEEARSVASQVLKLSP